jgi:hypothetical protein
MATKSSRTSTVKAKPVEKTTSAPKIARKKSAPAYEAIAVRAFEMYLERGGAHGRDIEDWLAAEAELSR